MTEKSFVDYYEVLQISPNADSDTIERMFRHLAKRVHPDNRGTGDVEKFRMLVEANRVLSDPEQRAAYDVDYQDLRAQEWGLAEEANGVGGYEDDQVLRDRLLSLLYVQRRRDVENAAIGNMELERLLSCPPSHLEFHMWYLKEKKLVESTSRGFAISALGIDEAQSARHRLSRDRMLPERIDDASQGEPRIPIGAGDGEGPPST